MTMRTLITTVLLVLASWLHGQNLNNITWNPSAPDECDYVEMNLTGNFPGSNYAADSFDFNYVGFTIEITLHCSGGGGGGQTPFSQALPSGGPYPAGTYTLNGFLRINGAQVDTWTGTKNVTPATVPDPGAYNEVELCNSDPNVTLISLLGGSPDPGGTWRDPNGVVVANGIFDPGQSQQGFYTYEFDQNFPCADTSQQVLVTYLANSSAGTNGSITVCVNAPAFPLFNSLGGSPDTNGAWTYQGNSVSSTFTPGTSPAGVYTYTVPGIPPCGNPTANVTVSVTQPGNPGVGSNVVVCDTDTAFQLWTALTGNPAQTGTWYDPNGFPMANGYNAMFNALIDFTGAFEYRVTVPPCAPVIAIVNVSTSSATPPCGNLDCMGVLNGPDEPGTPCDDGQANTINDTWTANCDCIGIPIGIDEPEAAAGMVLQPNPATESITIETPSGRMTGYDMFSMDGRLVRSENLNAARTTIERKDLASGTYRVVVRFAEGRATRSIVLQ